MTQIDEATVLRTLGSLYLQVEALRAQNVALGIQLRRAEARAAENESPSPQEESPSDQ